MRRELHMGSGGTWTSEVISHAVDLPLFLKAEASRSQDQPGFEATAIRNSTGTTRNSVTKKVKLINTDINPPPKSRKLQQKQNKKTHATLRTVHSAFPKKLMQIKFVNI